MRLSLLRKVYRELWRFNQPLTKPPSGSASPISDLFLWRGDGNWKTMFALSSRLFLTSALDTETIAEIRIFDKSGLPLADVKESIKGGKQKRLVINKLSEGLLDYGSFAVFHDSRHKGPKFADTYAAERGYTSFSNGVQAIGNFVHGNLDAIALNTLGDLEPLGGRSILKRDFHLQLILDPKSRYELYFTNPTDSEVALCCSRICLAKNERVEIKEASIPPIGTTKLDFDQLEAPSRVVVRSQLVMARPIVFRYFEQGFDVFHG